MNSGRTPDGTDRLVNDADEYPLRNESSSAGSSLTDLKQLLQELPPSNEATHVYEHANLIDHECHWYRGEYASIRTITSRIDEKEEEELSDQYSSGKSSCGINKAKERRRENLRYEDSYFKTRNMVISQSNAVSPAKSVDKTENEGKPSNSARQPVVNSSSDVKKHPSPPLLFEKAECHQGSSSKPSSTHSPYRTQNLDNGKNSSEMQAGIIHQSSNVCFVNSPNRRIELEPLSSIVLSNVPSTKFARYRHSPSIILTNLSSESESESNESDRNKVGSASKNRKIITTSSAPMEISVKESEQLSAKSETINGLYSPSSLFNKTSQYRDNLTGRVHSSKECESTCSAEGNKFHDKEYKLDTPCPTTSTDQRHIPSPAKKFEEDSEVGSIFRDVSYNKRCASYRQDDRTGCSSELFDTKIRKDETRDFLGKLKNERGRIKTSWSFPSSAREREDKVSAFGGASEYSGTLISEGHGIISTPKRLLADEYNKVQENDAELLTKGDNESSSNTYEIKDGTNVPTLALNSQEISYSVTPSSKEYSEKCILDTRTLFKALSDISLTEERKSERISSNSRESGSIVNETWQTPESLGSRKSPGAKLEERRSIRKCSRIPVRVTDCKCNSTPTEKNLFSESVEISINDATDVLSPSRVSPNIFDPACSNMFASHEELCSNSEEKQVESEKGRSSVTNLCDYTEFNESRLRVDTSTPLCSRVQSDDESSRVDNFERTFAKLNDDSRFRNSAAESNVEVADDFDIQESFIRSPDQQAINPTIKPSGMFINAQSQHLHRANCEIPEVHSKCRYNNFLDAYGRKRIENASGFKRRKFEHQIGDCEYSVAMAQKSLECDMRIAKHSTDRDLYMEDASLDNRLPRAKLETVQNEGFKPKNEYSAEKLAAEKFRKNLRIERAKAVESENSEVSIQRFPYILKPTFSTSKIHALDATKDPRRFQKKSRDRFPFTISEKSSAAFIKFKLAPIKNTKSVEAGYKLDAHPSITRLARSGFEETPADIISCVAYDQREAQRDRGLGMKGFVQRLSSRLRGSRKRREESDTLPETTRVIYENRDYKEDSAAESESGESFVQEFEAPEPKDRLFDNFTTILSLRASNKCFLDADNIEDGSWSPGYPCRRFDRDNLWVGDLKEHDSDNERYVKPLSGRKSSGECKESYKARDSTIRFKRKRKATEDSSCSTLFEAPLSSRTKSIERSVDKEDDQGDCQNDDDGDKDEDAWCLCSSICRLIARTLAIFMPKYRAPISQR